MQNVVLTVHLILALLLTGVVLLQRSEGGGLGLGGGGGGGGGVMTGRQAANMLTRLTWIFGIALFVTSLSLTIIAARQSTGGSVMDQLGASTPVSESSGNLPALPTYAPPPGTGQPVTPPAPDAAVTTPAETTATPEAVTPPAAETAPEVVTPEAAAPEAAAPAAATDPVVPQTPVPAETPATPAPAN